MSVVTVVTRIEAPPDRCFDLARSIDVHLRSAAATGESAVAGVTTGLIGMGEQVTFRGRHFGMWREMTSRITVYDRPRHFRDSMVAGPFRHFDHDHHFEAEGEATRMTDVYQFTLGYGPIGRLIDRLLLEGHFARFVTRRNRILKDIAESDRWREFLT